MKSKIYRYIFVISILLNVVFFASLVKNTYEKKFQLNKDIIQKEMINKRRDSLLVDKKLLYSDSTAIILTLGQSNSANYGQGTYECHNQVFNYFKGNLYKAKDPLLGASGPRCSVWTRLADMLIDSGFYNKVIIIPIGIGGVSVDCWANLYCNKTLQETLQLIEKDSIKITHVIWHQGETDNILNTPKEVYKSNLKKVLAQIREYGISSNFYVCVASYHYEMIDKNNGIDTIIQNAQIEFCKENAGTKLGPNTDIINNLASDRNDGVHFSKRGLDKFAVELFNKITE